MPAVPAPQGGDVCCPRCQSVFESAFEPVGEAAVSARLDDPSLDITFWEMDGELDEADQLVRHVEMGAGGSTVRVDPPHLRAPATRATAQPKSKSPSLVVWLLLSVGLMAFVFGAVLVGWSFAGGRTDLWEFGLPFALGGQVLLLLALIIQLDSLWRGNQDAQASLKAIDVQLRELEELTTNRSPAAQSFYAHMSEGASPHLLLADLKSQLDLLATRLHRQE